MPPEVVEVVHERVGDERNRARAAGRVDELLDRASRSWGCRPPRCCPASRRRSGSGCGPRAFAHDLGVQLEHRAREVRAPDRVGVAGHRRQVVHGQLLEALGLEQRHQLRGCARHGRGAGWRAGAGGGGRRPGARSRRVRARCAGPARRHAVIGNSLSRRDTSTPGTCSTPWRAQAAGHRVVAGGGVVVGQGDRAQPAPVRLGRQLLGRLRPVGERRVRVQIDHPRRLVRVRGGRGTVGPRGDCARLGRCPLASADPRAVDA